MEVAVQKHDCYRTHSEYDNGRLGDSLLLYILQFTNDIKCVFVGLLVNAHCSN